MDTKLNSFLKVVDQGSYTKAAIALHLTQPAITQHIKSLEEYFGASLLSFENRQLLLTKAGEEVHQYVKDLEAMETILFRKLHNLKRERREITFASTLTIGEFTMAPIIPSLLYRFSNYDLKMRVDNTENILESLRQGKISFALIEGLFQGEEFKSQQLKTCPFILVTAKNHPLTKKKVWLKDLLKERLIIREEGSGSREILEMGLRERNQSIEAFSQVMELGNVNLMKSMVQKDMGISLMYKDAALKELAQGSLVEVNISDLEMTRGFYFVRLKNLPLTDEQEAFFHFIGEKMREK